MDKTVTEFYVSKDKDVNYANNYELEHGPRLDAIVERFNLKELKDKKILDIGGGCGFLGKRLDLTNDYWIIDGAKIPSEKLLCKCTYLTNNLDYDFFGADLEFSKHNDFDATFCFEVLEHLTNPYHCLAEAKKITKIGGDVYLSIPDVSVTHNTIYPGLIYPPQNFAQFLQQMSLPIVDYYLFDKGWKTHIFKCRNAKWEESKMLFPKQESKFFGKTPVEYTNI